MIRRRSEKAINQYWLGSLVRVSNVFKDVAGAPADPETVNVEINKPDRTSQTYVHGTDEEVVKDGVGQYHMDVNADQPGEWSYRWFSTGAGQAVDVDSFLVWEVP